MKKNVCLSIMLTVCFSLCAIQAEAAVINRIYAVLDGTESNKLYLQPSIRILQGYLNDRKFRRQSLDEVMAVIATNNLTPIFDGTLAKNVILGKYLEDTKAYGNKWDELNMGKILQDAERFFARPLPSDAQARKIFIMSSDFLQTGLRGSRDSRPVKLGQDELKMLQGLNEVYFLYIDEKAANEFLSTFSQAKMGNNIILKSPTAMASGYALPVPIIQEPVEGGAGTLIKVLASGVVGCLILAGGLVAWARRRQEGN